MAFGETEGGVRDWLTGETIPVRVIEPGRETAVDDWDALAAIAASAAAAEAELDAMAEGKLSHLHPEARLIVAGGGDAVHDLEAAAFDRLDGEREALAAQARAMTLPEGGWRGRGMPPVRRILTLAP